MANHLYGHHKPISGIYNSSTRSAIEPYLPETSSIASRYLSSYPTDSYSPSSEHSALFRYSADCLSHSDMLGLGSGTAAAGSRSILSTPTSGSLWPSFDVSNTLSKRPSEALFNHSILGANMVGYNEAWLTPDSLPKRRRLESASLLPVYPQRPGEKDCTHYMLTRSCKFGDTCKFDHPIWVPAGGIPDWKESPPVPFESHPERPGEPDCPYFLKTQKCKFGQNCKFNHPQDKLDTSGKSEASNLPERPSEPLCSFYMKTGNCKFGASCKYHHPKDIQVSLNGQTDNGVQTQSMDDLGSDGDESAVKPLTSNPPSSYNTKGLPIRSGEVDCPFYMKTGSCKYGANCRYNHPDRIGHAVLPSLGDLNVGLVNPAASILQNLQPGFAPTMFGQVPVMYPQRPGHTECEHYMRTGECKFGDRCKFHHPIYRSAPTTKQTEQNVKLTLAGLPRREGVQNCPFYMKTGTCSYGINCKFDHPPPGEVMASTGQDSSTNAKELEELQGNEEKEGNVATAE
ncbi:unnamed protein product [Amaranthus hypochondriacus]